MSSSPLWQGPRPYLESDHERFVGRKDERDVLVEMIRRNRLLIVTAPSGVGKTSLLLAGVIPELRLLHHDELRGDAPKLVGPTLVCRTWSRLTDARPNAVLIDAINQAVMDLSKDGKEGEFPDAHFVRDCGDEALRPKLKEELKHLVDVSERGQRELKDATTYVSRLAEKLDRLTIFFDQFEDALRLSKENSVLLKIIARLYETESRVRVVLSLRHEYMMQLHDLEVRVGGLAPRTYYLRSVPVGAVTAIIKTPIEAAKLSVEDKAINTIKQWLDLPVGSESQPPGEAADKVAESQARSMGSLSLLHLQALLVDIYDFMKNSGETKGLTDQLLADYVKNRNRSRLAIDAVENYISKTVDPSMTRYTLGSNENPSGHLLARLFARLAPRLTSRGQPGAPGYKIQVPFISILTEVLKPDLTALRARKCDAPTLLQLKTNPANVDLALDEPPPLVLYNSRSGPSRKQRLLEPHTAQQLVLALTELLKRLEDGNILKKLGTDNDEAYELVHDGLGEAVASWSEWFQSTMFDALSSLTVISGVTFRWTHQIPPKLLIDSVFWQGCSIDHATFAETTFQACDLRGTVFSGCDFKGVRFIDCILDGAMFLDCSFSTHVEDDPCEFTGGLIGSALFADCKISNLRFSDTVLDGSIFKKNTVYGSIDIANASLEVSVLLDCKYTPDDNQRRGVIRIAASDISCTRIICTGAEKQTRVVIKSDCEVFPKDLRDSFQTEPDIRHSKTRLEVIQNLEARYLSPVAQEEEHLTPQRVAQ